MSKHQVKRYSFLFCLLSCLSLQFVLFLATFLYFRVRIRLHLRHLRHLKILSDRLEHHESFIQLVLFATPCFPQTPSPRYPDPAPSNHVPRLFHHTVFISHFKLLRVDNSKKAANQSRQLLLQS